MSDNIITNEELQRLLSKNLSEDNLDNITQRKAVYMGAGRLLTSIKIDMEAANKMGGAYFPRTKKFLGLE